MLTMWVSDGRGEVLHSKRVACIQDAMHWVEQHEETMTEDVRVVVDNDRTHEIVLVTMGGYTRETWDELLESVGQGVPHA